MKPMAWMPNYLMIFLSFNNSRNHCFWRTKTWNKNMFLKNKHKLEKMIWKNVKQWTTTENNHRNRKHRTREQQDNIPQRLQQNKQQTPPPQHQLWATNKQHATQHKHQAITISSTSNDDNHNDNNNHPQTTNNPWKPWHSRNPISRSYPHSDMFCIYIYT